MYTSHHTISLIRNSVRTMASSEKAATWKEEKQRRLDQSVEERRKVGWTSVERKVVKIALFFRNIFVRKIL